MKYIMDVEALVDCLAHINHTPVIQNGCKRIMVDLNEVVSFIQSFPKDAVSNKIYSEEAVQASFEPECVVVEGHTITSLKDAYNWLKQAWVNPPYHMWYEDFGEDSDSSAVIFIEPSRGNESLSSHRLTTLKQFEEFVSTHT